MFEKTKSCQICNGTKFNKHIECKDHMLTGQIFTLTSCDNCSFLFTNPRPDTHTISNFYKSGEYISHSNNANNLINTTYKIARQFTLYNKLKIINSLSAEKTILDYGCGTGEFISFCNKKGWDITGFEPDKSAREKAIDLTKTNILSTNIELQNAPPKSLITLWHVLEHISDLNNTFSLLKSKLNNDGKFLIAVPNHKSFDAIYYDQFWAAYDVPRHLYHFSQKTMKLFLKKHALKIYKIIPMKLDSFYVSMLSEKYKNGYINYFKSFINGYKSNLYASKNNNNYSSLIYIAGK